MDGEPTHLLPGVLAKAPEIRDVGGRAPSRMLSSLQSPNLRRFFIGQAVSQSGTWVQKLAIGILVLRLTDSGVALGLASVAQFGPLLFLGPAAGVLCDRLDRQRLLLAINAAGMLVGAAFAVLVTSGSPPLWAIYLATLATGVVQAFENPTRRVFVSDLVDNRQLQSALGLNSLVMTVCDIVALAVAGLLISGPGIGWCFVVNPLSFIPQLALFAGMDRSAFRSRTPVARARGQFVEALVYTWHNPALRRPLMLLVVVGMFGFGAHPVLVPLLATRELGGGTGTYTLLFMSMSVGGLAGSLTSAQRLSSDTAFLARTSAAFGVLNVAFGAAPTTAVATVLALAVGFVLMLTIAGMNASMQREAAAQLRGRVLSIVSMVAIGTGSIGGPVVGWVADAATTRAAFALGGVASVATALAILRPRVRRRSEGGRGW